MTTLPPRPNQASSFVGPLQDASASSVVAPVSQATSEEDGSTRMRILMAAGPIFAAKGFHQATVREICDSASVNIASIKYYFGDKQSLYRDSVLLARQMRVEEFPNPDWNQPLPPSEKLRQVIALILNRIVVETNDSWQVQLLMNEIQQPTETCEQLASEFFRPFMDRLIEVINEVAGVALPRKTGIQLALNIVGQCMIYRFAPQTRTMTLGEVFANSSQDRIGNVDFSVELDSLVTLITQFSLGGIERATSSVAIAIDTNIHDDDLKSS